MYIQFFWIYIFFHIYIYSHIHMLWDIPGNPTFGWWKASHLWEARGAAERGRFRPDGILELWSSPACWGGDVRCWCDRCGKDGYERESPMIDSNSLGMFGSIMAIYNNTMFIVLKIISNNSYNLSVINGKPDNNGTIWDNHTWDTKWKNIVMWQTQWNLDILGY